MYLECRKSFFGKVKYFLQAKKGKKLNKVQEVKQKTNTVEIVEEKIEFTEKENYTIEDLVKICKQLDKFLSDVKKMQLDIKASENKIENMRLKIENATLYIEEIDSHEKSIFEFWKFANKDEQLMLSQGSEAIQEYAKKISKIFDYEEDLEEFGVQIDKTQRAIFSKEQTDAIYTISTEQREIINNIDNNKVLQEGLDMLKQKAESEKVLFQKENFDIFGGISEDSTKIKLIGNKKHREVAKDIVQILDITKNTNIEEYKEALEKQENNFKVAMEKSSAPIDMQVFIEAEKIDGEIQKAHINPEKAINEADGDKIYLHKINIKQGNNIIYLSNIIFYENNNRTLPLGMDITDCAVIDLTNIKLNPKAEISFRIINEKEENKTEIKQVMVIEYDIV